MIKQKLYPIQQWGIGDIIFQITLVRKIARDGDYEVIWAVLPEHVEGLNRAYPDIAFLDYRDFPQSMFSIQEDKTVGDIRYLPLRWADSLCRVPYKWCMKSKYMLYKLPWEMWKDDAKYERNLEWEKTLSEHLGIKEGEQYNLINHTYRADYKGHVGIAVENGFKNVHMNVLPGFSLFDWSYVIERAMTIHTVSTSIIYILELLKLTANAVHVYIRRPIEASHQNYDYILQSHNYILEP